MRDRSMRSETELAREIKLTDWSMAGNLSNRSSGVQIPRDIRNRLKRYLYSAKCSWIIRPIDHFHKWRPIINSFANIKISLTNLILKLIIQKRFYSETRLVRLI